MTSLRAVVLALCLLATPVDCAARAGDMPRLQQKGNTKQLLVDGKPFLILGGELSNSSASDLAYLNKQWPTLKAVGLNTVIAPVEWDQVEPTKGRYDFTLVDGLINQAYKNNAHLVLLWFGAWKNSMSTYAPAYIKHDYQTYARARDDKDQAQDILSAFDPDTLSADSRAFAALMAHLKVFDKQHTVVMMQVENEIGMLPSVRDFSPQAQSALNEPVPPELIAYLKAHLDALQPNIRQLWEARGFRETGSWIDIFGPSPEAQEVFQAWHYARFADALTKAGKAQYALPMYVNVALNRPGKLPGQYPSAGPLPHLFDIWKAGATDIDFIGIDLYFPDFVNWADKFKRPDNPFFIPEANQAGKPEAAANAFYAIGELNGIGFSPFAIDKLSPENSYGLTQAYSLLHQLTPQILVAQSEGRIRGFRPRVSYDGVVDESPQSFTLGNYRFTVTFVDPWTGKEGQTVASNGGLIIQTREDTFIVAGTGIVVTFEDAAFTGHRVGIEQIVEGTYVNGTWRPGRWLNGDETHQGRHLRIGTGQFGIQQVKLYKYN